MKSGKWLKNIITADFRVYDFRQRYDVIFFLGVLYHLEDVFGCMIKLGELLEDTGGSLHRDADVPGSQSDLPIFEYASDIYPTVASQDNRSLSGVGISNYLFPNEHAIRNLAYSYDFRCEALDGPHNTYTKENPTRRFYKFIKRGPLSV